MNLPKVSVIIPVYNVAPYLKRSMDSVVNQTLSDIEIICIDDCSTDNSLEILEEYASKDKRIKLISLEKNSGAAVARNKGLDVAKGEYLGFIDPDDEIDLNFYEELYKKAKEDDADIVKAKRKDINVDGSIRYSEINRKIEKLGKFYFLQEWTTAIYKHKIILDFDIRFPVECCKAQDVVFQGRVIHKSNILSIIDNVEYIYHRRKNSLNGSKIPLKSIKSALWAEEILINELNKSDLFNSDRHMYFILFRNYSTKIFRSILYQNDSIEAKRLCAKYLVTYFDICKDAEYLKQIFPIPKLVPLIEIRDIEKITDVIKKYKSKEHAYSKQSSIFEKIFSVRNSKNKSHKIICIFGLKLKIKRRKR